jgi:hypothetical protein
MEKLILEKNMARKNSTLLYLMLLLTLGCSTSGLNVVSIPEDSVDTSSRTGDSSEIPDVVAPDVTQVDQIPDTIASDLSPDIQPFDIPIGDIPEDLPDPADIIYDEGKTDGPYPPCETDGDCDDGGACTTDSCADGVCQFVESVPGSCCSANYDCDDGIDCTNDKCAAGMCQHYKADNFCCTGDHDCDDYEPCTIDLCVAEKCSRVWMTGYQCQCEDIFDCDDGLACTYEYCEAGTCVYDLNPVAQDCCAADSECVDSDTATIDACLQLTCSNLPVAPCTDDSHCDDDNPCTTDSCGGGLCAHPEMDGCCLVNGQCEDGNPSTVDQCVTHQCVHGLSDPPEACSEDGDCALDNLCLQWQCIGEFCSYQPLAGADCCATNADCDDSDICTADSCSDFQCSNSSIGGPVSQVVWNFDNGSFAGWNVSGGSGAITWGLSSSKAISIPSALYFGDPSGPTIDNGKTVAGTVLSPPVTLGTTSPIIFKGWTYIECEPLYSRDLVSISLVHGNTKTEVFSKEDVGGTTGWKWMEFETDLTELNLGGEEIRFEFRFDSVDAKANDYEGIYFDDLQVQWPCQ